MRQLSHKSLGETNYIERSEFLQVKWAQNWRLYLKIDGDQISFFKSKKSNDSHMEQCNDCKKRSSIIGSELIFNMYCAHAHEVSWHKN